MPSDNNDIINRPFADLQERMAEVDRLERSDDITNRREVDYRAICNYLNSEIKYWEPESVIVEAKASGLPLIQELRQLGIPVINFTPSKGNDKLSRVHAVAPVFESGAVWAPDKRWAEEMIEECAMFPHAKHDDLINSKSQTTTKFL